MLAAFAALGYAVSARFILLLSVVCGFALAVLVILRPSVVTLLVVGIYGLLIVVPLVLLESGKVRPKE